MKYTKLIGEVEICEMIKQGVEANMVVLDCDAPVHTLSYKLLWCMGECARENKLRLHTLIIPVWGYKDEYCRPGLVIEGLYITPHLFLDSQRAEDYYKKTLGGSMPIGKEHLVVAYGNNDVLLGAF